MGYPESFTEMAMRKNANRTATSSLEPYPSAVSRAVDGQGRRVRLPGYVVDHFGKRRTRVVVLLPWSKHCVLVISETLWRSAGFPLRLFGHTDFSTEQMESLERTLVHRDTSPVDAKGRIGIPKKLHKDNLNGCNRVTIIPLSCDVLQVWEEKYIEGMPMASEKDMALTRRVFLQAMSEADSGNGQKAYSRRRKG